MSIASALPRWDMSVVYPGLQSPQFAASYAALVHAIVALRELLDRRHIEQRPRQPLDEASVAAFEEVVARFNAVLDHYTTVSAYAHSFVSTDSRDTVAQARASELEQQGVQVSLLDTRLTAWIGSLDVDALIERSAVARAHAFMLRQAQIAAAHQMSPAEEALARELDPSSGMAWHKLHGTITSQVSVPVELAGGTRELPMSAVRNLAFAADRMVRRRAYEAELAGWQTVAVPLAAALNSIKGQVNVLCAKRHWQTPLDAALFAAHIDQATLDAMLGAAREAFPDFRRYLHAKARALGVARLAWYDLLAPVGTTTRVWSFDEAAAFVIAQFGTYSQRMSDFATRAFRERWVDAEPRPGKRDGAFCMPLRGEESRVLVNFTPAYDGMSTLAHELGHGYHNLNLAQRTPLQRDTPMTLAETASTFCETVVRHAAIARAEPREQLSILAASLQGDCQIVVDISSRFIFEQAVFGQRRERELSIEELNALMLGAQRATYGDGLDPAALHPYMWAVKLHYYSAHLSYYNFPYMFGLLFGLGLYACYQQDPEGFRTRYDDLLASTGLDDAAGLARRFGIDIHTPQFWRASLDVLRADIDRFVALVDTPRASS